MLNRSYSRPLLLTKNYENRERLKSIKKSIDLKRKILQTNTENWLSKHGKSQYVQFTKEKKSNLRNCFLSIDLNGSKTIELEEIIETMLTLGIADSSAQAKKIFEDIDRDGNGHIEFNEFCMLLKDKNPKIRALNQLFDNVIEKKMGIQSELMPFQIVVSNYRRKMIMNAVMQPGNQREELILKSTSKVFSRKFSQMKLESRKKFPSRNSLKNLMSLNIKKPEDGSS